VDNRQAIQTQNAPGAIGPYSQAIKSGRLVFASGQIPLNPLNMTLVEGGISEQTIQVFENLAAIATASGGSLDNAVKVTIYLTDLGNFPIVNEIMARYFSEPYPARATIGVSSLPKGAAVEIDAILAL
jgi:reactive intermediate/imine deaminase